MAPTASQIRHAAGVAELQPAARQVDALVARWHDEGVGAQTICARAGELNRALFARLWELLAPAELVGASCLLVMGSEGRGEQMLKTDQDNALLLRDGLRDGVEFPDLAALTERFTATLIDFGYPRCPGNIMLSNPLWCQPLASFRQTLGSWIFNADAEGLIDLAIFLDAAVVAGDAALLRQARGFVDAFVVDNDAFFARFARAADQFREPHGGWWARLVVRRGEDEPAFDLKKHGSFPIVHGARALALQYHVTDLSTAARLRALAAHGHLAARQADELTEALYFVMSLRLAHQLGQRRAGTAVDNLVRPSQLAPDERVRLRGALGVIRRFRQHLRLHFRLDAL